MPSFPSYYLSDLERKRERSRKLREGLQSGMAGAFEGVDRLAQLQMALQGKAAAGEEKKAKAATEAERWKAEQGTEADRWKAEHELSLRREDRLDRDRVGAATPETEAPAETTSDILTRMQGVLGGQESGEIVPEDVEGQTTSPEASGILEKLRASMEPGAIEPPAAPTPSAPRPAAAKVPPKVVAPSLDDQIKAERLKKAKADAALAQRKVDEMQRDPALANAPPTVLQFWGNVKGTAEAMRKLGKEVTKDDFSLAAKAQANLPTIAQSDRVRKVTSLIDRIVQRAGVGMEGGKLAEGDIARYRAMLMNAMDSYEGFTAATEEIAAELDQKVADEQSAFRGGGTTSAASAPTPSDAAKPAAPGVPNDGGRLEAFLSMTDEQLEQRRQELLRKQEAMQ